MIPNCVYYLEMPEPLSNERAFLRIHARAVRGALTRRLEAHHRKLIPGHFSEAARTKYHHAPRQPGYKAFKMRAYHSRTDLVASGRTKRLMLSQYRLTVSGNAQDGMVATLSMRFPFSASFERSTNRVSLVQMAKEIGTVTSDEANEHVTQFKRDYLELFNADLARSPRLLKRAGGFAT